MEGMLNENGPWMVYETNTLHYNPYSWNTEVNMLFIEQVLYSLSCFFIQLQNNH